MKNLLQVVGCFAVAFQPTTVMAVLYGDEQFGNVTGGTFWAFHSAGVSIVNPTTCSIEQTFTTDNEGSFLPTAWYDGVYMERTIIDDESRRHRLLHHDEGDHNEVTMKTKKGMILINSAVTISDGHINEGGGTGEVLAFSTDPEDYADGKSPVLAKVLVGARPVHSYGLFTRDEFWTHSDGDGHFYIIRLEDVSAHTGNPVVAKVNEAAHGKLLWDEDSRLTNHGFATSTGEQHFFIIDIEAEEQVKTYDYSQDVTGGTCFGTHAIAYSADNNHLYLECVGGGGIIEYDVFDPINPVFVAQHPQATGSLYETPDQSVVVAANKGGNLLHVFLPNGTGQASSIEFDVVVEGHPSTPTFYPNEDGTYTACMPLTENTNRNHMDSSGNVVCDAYGCSGAATPEDVANGICHYDATGRLLQTATMAEMEQVVAQEEPFGNACGRCTDPNNYEGPAGTPQDQLECTCTPFCGSCADDDYDASNSGVVCVNLNDVTSRRVSVEQAATLIKGAGSVLQGGPRSGSAECGFGFTHRTHKRGDKWDASVANFPTNSIQLVNMMTQEFECAIDLPGKPDRVVYVPPHPTNESSGSPLSGDDSSDDGLSSGAIAGIVIAVLVVVAVVAYMVMGGHRSNKGPSTNEQAPEGPPAASKDETLKDEAQIN